MLPGRSCVLASKRGTSIIGATVVVVYVQSKPSISDCMASPSSYTIPLPSLILTRMGHHHIVLCFHANGLPDRACPATDIKVQHLWLTKPICHCNIIVCCFGLIDIQGLVLGKFGIG